MLTNFLVKTFIKDSEQIERAKVRTDYGILASMVGIFCNVLLFGGKLAVGMLLNSVAVMADAFNNLSDAASSVVGFVGVRMASKPADEDHPFGHGRIEYITALVVAFLVIQVGFSLLKTSFGKIGSDEELTFTAFSLVILLCSIGVKLWMAHFNGTLGKKIQSKVMLATATDAFGDVVTTTATIVSLLVSHFLHLNIDGIVGVGVALVIMWAGIGIAKDTLEPLIGEAVDPEVYEKITNFVESYEGIVGSHDLIVHNYGPTKSLASIHAEVPSHVNIEHSHEIIDQIEKDAIEKLGIFMVIHMDPVETENELVTETKEVLARILEQLDASLSFHDFRMVNGEHQINLIFDVIVPYDYTREQQTELHHAIVKEVQKVDSKYQCVITMEKSFVGKIK